MAQAEMVKIGLIGLLKEKDEIIEVIYNFGEVQLIESHDGKDDLSDKVSGLEYELAQIKFSLEFIALHKKQAKMNWRDKIIAALNKDLKVSDEEIRRLAKEFKYKEVVQKIEYLQEQIKTRENKQAELKLEVEEIRPWQVMNFDYQRKISPKVEIKIGIMTSVKSDELAVKIGAKKLPCELVKLNPDEKQLKVVLVYLKNAAAEVDEILNEIEFKEVNLPELKNVPAKAIKDKENEIKKIDRQIANLLKEAESLAVNETKLKIIFDYLSWQRDKIKAAGLAARGRKTFSLTGFIDRDLIKKLDRDLRHKTQNFCLFEMPIGEGEDVPVALKNKTIISPFESVTNIYGAPKRVELDPTPYLAPFFILFFGLCLSDAGYGILLAVFSYLAIRILKIPSKKQGFFRLLIYAGISTFIIGVLFGGWFGLVLEELPRNFLTGLLLRLKVIDPVKNPLTMLIFSLILGAIQIIVGIIINLFYQLKRKDWGKSFDSGMWLLFLFGLVFWLLASRVFSSHEFSLYGKYWIWAAMAGLVLTQGRRSKNIFLKLPLGVLSLYNLVGYFSDVMSYSRLLALGLSTGIIAMVINMVAMLFKDMIPWVGWIMAILILIGGHLFNLAINALGSFIHSGRLQYVEFFPKFMEGGGTRFKPFKKTARYVSLDEEE